jgi:DNA-binding CsgD family transcriptional regulator
MNSSLKEHTAGIEQDTISKKEVVDYELILKLFVDKSIILQIMPDAQKLGIFLYSLESKRIVYGNEDFLDFYKFKHEHLSHPAIRRYIFSRLHPEDAKHIKSLELRAQVGQQSAYLNKVVRIRKENNLYNSYHFLILNLQGLSCAYGHLRVGIQISVANMEEDCNAKTELSNCRRMIANLSKRECDILRLIVKGFTDNEIGHQLYISSNTAQKHRKNILKKLKVKNTASLSYIAGKSNLI